MKRLYIPCAEVLLILIGFFAIVAADGLFDIAGVVLFGNPSDWQGVLRVVNHPLAPH